MKKLNVRFPDAVKLKINDLSDVVEVSDSVIARAAVTIGLQLLVTMAAKDHVKTKEYIRVQSIKSQL